MDTLWADNYTVTVNGELSDDAKAAGVEEVIPYEYELTVLTEPTTVDIMPTNLGNIMDEDFPNYIKIPTDKALVADGLQYIRDNLTLIDPDGIIPFGEPIITVLKANGTSGGRFVSMDSSIGIEVTCADTDEYKFNPLVGTIMVLVK